MNPSLTIVIPAYNEAESLKSFLPEVIAYCLDKGFSLVVVNDGSSDQTEKVVEELFKGTAFLLVRHKVNRGYGGAIKSGILTAHTDFVITLDADGQHQPPDVLKLYQKMLSTDADMVIGKRVQARENLYRKFGKGIIRFLARRLMPMNLKDLNSGMKLYNTGLARKYLPLCPDSMAYSDVMALVFLSQRHLVIEEEIKILPRKSGKSTINTGTALETVLQILNMVVLFNPMRIFFPVSVFFVLAGILWDIPIFLRGDGVSVGAVLLIICGLMFFFFGLIAEQVSLTRKARTMGGLS